MFDAHPYPVADALVHRGGRAGGFALGSWLAFKPMGNEAMVMGDLVLTGDEVNPVMKKLLESGLQVTALHNHLLRSEPGTMYMHVSGHGEPVKLAAALHEGLAMSKTPMGPPAAAAPPGALGFDTAAVDAAMGFKGKPNGPAQKLAKGLRAALDQVKVGKAP